MKQESKNLQTIILSIVMVLMALGLIMIYSTSAMVAQMDKNIDNAHFFIKKQFIWVLISCFAMIVCMNTSYLKLEKYAYPIFFAALILLALVLIPGVGTKYNGARRWIRAFGVGFQPSDFMKFAIVIAIAAYAQRNFHLLKHFFSGFLPVFTMIAGTCFLVLLEPDFGTCCFIFLISITLLIVAGINLKHLLPVSFVALPFVIGVAFFKFSHIKARIAVYLNPDLDPLGKGYQMRQSLIALGTGNNFGLGLGWSRQKLFFLSEESTDFIFAIIGEELGFLGTSLIILLFICFLHYGFKVVSKAPDVFGSLLALGIVMAISLQAIFNISVVTQTVPAKGISLPFISFGGSGLLFSMVGVGILLNIAGHCYVKENSMTSAQVEKDAPTTATKTILFAGGGTGGHLLPGISLAKEIQKTYPKAKSVFLVPGKPVDVKLLSQSSFTWFEDPMRPVPGTKKKIWEFSKRFAKSLASSEKLFRETRPSVVVALGGYGAFSASVVAIVRRVPLVMIESNAVAGKVVRLLSVFSKAIYAPWQIDGVSRNKVIQTGIPLRQELLTKEKQTNKLCTILVMGGSQGARVINENICAALPYLKELQGKIRFIHLVGDNDTQKFQQVYSDNNFCAEVYSFSHKMEELYSRSDLAICRAGGGTIAELTALGIPAILVPFAKAAHNHQRENSRRLERAQAAIVIKESKISGETLATQISKLMDAPQMLVALTKAAIALGKPKAAAEIVRHIFYLVERFEPKSQQEEINSTNVSRVLG